MYVYNLTKLIQMTITQLVRYNYPLNTCNNFTQFPHCLMPDNILLIFYTGLMCSCIEHIRILYYMHNRWTIYKILLWICTIKNFPFFSRSIDLHLLTVISVQYRKLYLTAKTIIHNLKIPTIYIHIEFQLKI